jgi:hypothetical protein
MKIFKNQRSNEYNKMTEYINNYDPDKYAQTPSWFLDHAQNNFELMKDYSEYLDGKADAMIRYLGIGIGVIGFFVKSISIQLCPLQKILIIVAILSWALALFMALFTKIPADSTYPPSLIEMIKRRDQYGDGPALYAFLALNYERAAEGQISAGGKKAKWLRSATCLLFISLATFLGSFLFIYF